MKPSESLFRSIRKSTNIADLSEKLGEVALDSLLNDGVLREIPVFGSALSLLKAGNEIQAYFLSKKIIRFLSELESITEEDRIKFIKTYEAESEGEENIGETTLMLLDKADSFILAGLMGKAFSLLIKRQIDKNLFEIYSYVIKSVNPYLIRQIRQFYGFDSFSTIDSLAAVQLSNYGIVDVVTLPVLSGPTNGKLNRSYEKTSFGQAFYEKIIKETA